MCVCSYLNAIQTCCPHIFRYITAAVITNKNRQSLLKDLVRVIKQVSSGVVDWWDEVTISSPGTLCTVECIDYSLLCSITITFS